MSLITDINDIVTGFYPDSTFLFSSYFKAGVKSREISKDAFPLVIFDNELTKQVEIMKNRSLNSETRIKIYFLNHDYPHKTDLEREAIRQEMETFAHKVMINIFGLPYIKVIGDNNQRYKIDPVFNAFIADKSGVVAEMQGIENLLINACIDG